MSNTALNRTVVAQLTNKSGGDLAYGAVVVIDTTTDSSFTTTTSGGYITTGIGVIIEPNGIASNATGAVAIGGWVPKVTLNTASTRGQFLKTHTVAGQGTPHSTLASGDFGYALEASSTPKAFLFGSVLGGVSPLTTKGDLFTYSSANARLAVGSNGQVLTADSGETTGIKWATPSAGGGGSAESLYEFDDFITNESTAGNYKFLYLWGTAPTLIASLANHPGIITLSGNATNTISTGNTAGRSLLPVDTFTAVAVVRPVSHTNCHYRVGLWGDIAIPPNNGIYFEGLTTDTNWFLITRSGGTETRTDTGVAITNNTWYKLTVYRKNGTTIGATVNAGTEVTSTTNIPTAGLNIFFGLTPTSGTQDLDIDFWSLADTVTRY